jgi:hypothetical protein
VSELEEYAEGARKAIHRLSRLSDYQEEHIAILERELRDARTVIESYQTAQEEGAKREENLA